MTGSTIPAGYASIPTPTSRAAEEAAAAARAGASAKAGGDLGKDTFLKLMVAQLRYQDPTSPVKGAEFIAQTAQFTTVETLQQISAASTEALVSQQRSSAATLVGRTVTYPGADGLPATGVVSAAVLGGVGGPVLRIGSTDVPLTAVSEVRSTL